MSLVIIVSVVITGLIMTLAWTAGVQAQLTGEYAKVDGAYYAAEAGAQRVAWYSKHGRLGEITSPLTGTVGGYAYSAGWTTVSTNTIRITSRGSLGNVAQTCCVTVTQPSAGPATFASGGDFDGKNIQITGDVQTGGNYSSGGNGSVSGNLTYAAGASNLNSVDGTVTHGPYTPLNFTAIETALQAAAGQTLSGNQSGKVFNFTSLPGTNKVIYVDGNVSSPTFIGAGTLYVNGAYSSGGFGTAAAPVNIVASGDITTSANITIHGSLYSRGDWNRGKVNLTGLVYVVGISASSNGSSSMTQGTPPWFDPRAPGGAASAMTFSNFAGPEP